MILPMWFLLYCVENVHRFDSFHLVFEKFTIYQHFLPLAERTLSCRGCNSSDEKFRFCIYFDSSRTLFCYFSLRIELGKFQNFTTPPAFLFCFMSEIYPQLGSMLGLKLKLKILEVWITQFEFSRQALWLV